MRKRHFIIFAVIILLITQTYCAEEKIKEQKMKFQITSSVFKQGEFIPSKHTCDGINVSPPLKWEGIPEGTRSLALICDDPDAPIGDWVHWIIYYIPNNINELKEGLPKNKELENGIKQGTTSFRNVGYGGPCPPSGTHRYFFKLYALDTVLDLDSSATKNILLDAMKNHIIESTELMGTYKRSR